MSCEQGANRIARLAGQVGAGISQLASKRAFYVGLALGTGSALGSLALVKAIRNRRQNGVQAGERQPVPVGRTKPQKIPKEALQRPGSRAKPKPIPVLSGMPAETKLEAASIRMQTDSGQPFTPKKGYRVIRPDGSETGLALTPFVQAGENGQLVEDDQRWGVTHAASGSLISGPYPDLSQAQELATQLAGLRWTEARVPAKDVSQAKQIISAYRPSQTQSQAEDK